MWRQLEQVLAQHRPLIYFLQFGSPACAPLLWDYWLHGDWGLSFGMIDYVVPVLLLVASLLALHKKENAYDLMLSGAGEGLKLLLSIAPALIMLLTAVTMLRASGAVQLISGLVAPVFSFLGIPPETALLVMIRPLSGSAALAVGAELMAQYGPDSIVGRTAAVMLGSTETTFYTISVYFGAAGIRKTRYTIPAALFADFVGFFMAALTTRLFWT
jgi:spore maturation protein B